MFPIFCGYCLPEGYDLPPIGTGNFETWDATNWRDRLAVTIWGGDAYCAKHWNEYRETGEVSIPD